MTIIGFAAACSPEPEDPGHCALSCSGAINASNDIEYFLEPMFTQSPGDIECTSANQTVQPISLMFRITEKYFREIEQKEYFRPVPFIKFNPVLNGSFRDVSAERGDTEEDADSKYRGVVTPKDNWCSDACGVMTVEVAPACPALGGENTVQIGATTGAVSSSTMYEITLTTPE
jgi:hypothetical protein